MTSLVGALLLTTLCIVSAERVSYEGYRLIEINQNLKSDWSPLLQWKNHPEIEFWKLSSGLELYASITASPKYWNQFKLFLQSNNFNYTVVSNNLEEIFEVERMQQAHSRQHRHILDRVNNRKNYTFEHFYNISETYEYVDYLANEYPHLVQTSSIGKTLEGRDIRIVYISKHGQVDGERPIVFVDAGIHAREWAAHMSVLHLLQNLVENSEKYDDIMHGIDWIIVPIANPDGYEYAHSKDRLWRKNRRVYRHSNCIGVDLNRNFGYKWESDSVCSEVTSGLSPFSEPESVAIADALLAHKEACKLYLTIHSFGEWVLYPWGYAETTPIDNIELFEEVGNVFARAAFENSGEVYTVGNSAGLLYPAAGGSDDYAASIGVDLSYTLEISKGRYGFVLPAEEINRVSNEVFAGIHAMAKYIDSYYQIKNQLV